MAADGDGVMAVRCPKCAREYDITLFAFGSSVSCICGEEVMLAHEERSAPSERAVGNAHILEVQRLADRIAYLITCTDYPQIDLEIEKSNLKERIDKFSPEKAHLYDLIYEPRFKRLLEQFRQGEED